jgi:hypothetical protein
MGQAAGSANARGGNSPTEACVGPAARRRVSSSVRRASLAAARAAAFVSTVERTVADLTGKSDDASVCRSRTARLPTGAREGTPWRVIPASRKVSSRSSAKPAAEMGMDVAASSAAVCCRTSAREPPGTCWTAVRARERGAPGAAGRVSSAMERRKGFGGAAEQHEKGAESTRRTRMTVQSQFPQKTAEWGGWGGTLARPALQRLCVR